jgi:hypothetical protein
MSVSDSDQPKYVPATGIERIVKDLRLDTKVTIYTHSPDKSWTGVVGETHHEDVLVVEIASSRSLVSIDVLKISAVEQHLKVI